MEHLLGKELGQYEIVSKIGEGGMAVVFQGYQASLERYVAIKVLPPAFAQRDKNFTHRFQREAKSIARLNHRNILTVYDFGLDNDISYIVMRYVKGGRTLADAMQTRLSIPQIVQWLSQIADGLDYAHREGVIHRDIKPVNALLDEDDWVLLSDFGLAKIRHSSEARLTQTGAGLGTPTYMSPEQGYGKNVDHRTDIYSLGIILYEMLTGQVPHNADTPLGIVIKRNTEPPTSPRLFNPDILESLAQVTMRALATSPDDRYHSAADFAVALRTAAADPSYREPVITQHPARFVTDEDSVPQFDANRDPRDSDSAMSTQLHVAVEEAAAAATAVSSHAHASGWGDMLRLRLILSIMILGILVGWLYFSRNPSPKSSVVLNTPTPTASLTQTATPTSEVNAAAMVSSTATATATPTQEPTATPRPRIGPILFSPLLLDDAEPISPTTVFSGTTTEVFATFSYGGFTTERPWEQRWLHEEELIFAESLPWPDEAQGRYAVSLSAKQLEDESMPLPAGQWTLRLAVGSAVTQVATFTIEALPTPTPRPYYRNPLEQLILWRDSPQGRLQPGESHWFVFDSGGNQEAFLVAFLQNSAKVEMFIYHEREADIWPYHSPDALPNLGVGTLHGDRDQSTATKELVWQGPIEQYVRYYLRLVNRGDTVAYYCLLTNPERFSCP